MGQRRAAPARSLRPPALPSAIHGRVLASAICLLALAGGCAPPPTGPDAADLDASPRLDASGRVDAAPRPDARPAEDTAPAADGGDVDASTCVDALPERALLDVSASFDGRVVTLRDVAGGVDLVAGGVEPVIPDGTVGSTVEARPATNGVDLLVTITNPGAEPVEPPPLAIDGILLASAGFSRRPIADSLNDQFLQTRPDGSVRAYGVSNYPTSAYSPVQVLSDGRHHVGVSLLYPVREYRHGVLMEVNDHAFVAPGVSRVRVLFTLRSSLATDAFGRPIETRETFLAREPGALLGPGETRSYVLALRVAPASASWLHTIVPYRNHFRAAFGPVRYAADPRPVTALMMAFTEHCPGASELPDSAEGFRPRYAGGWAPAVLDLLAVNARGFDRSMVWAPTGVYCPVPWDPASASAVNYPDQFLTRMDELPAHAGSVSMLGAVPDAGMSLGFWWGRSTTLRRPWASPDVRPLDVSDAASRALAFAEIDRAVALGATEIGLDAFADVNHGWNDWEGYEWLRALQAHAPSLRFVTEQLGSDMLHTLAPTFTVAATGACTADGDCRLGLSCLCPDGGDGCLARTCRQRDPDVLAAFLNPGHETWGLGYDLPAESALDLVEQVARVGIVPVVSSEVPAPDGALRAPAYRAAPIWDDPAVVPVELRPPCGR
jgi:hypothetical protein